MGEWSGTLWRKCEPYRQETGTNCSSLHLMKVSMQYYALYVFIIYAFGVGLVNNCLTTLFIFQKKYDNLLQVIPLRSFYVSNLISTFGGIVYMVQRMQLNNDRYPLYDIAFFISGTAVFFSDALLALMAVTRFLYTQFPAMIYGTNKRLHLFLKMCSATILLYSVGLGILVIWFDFDPFNLVRAMNYLWFILITAFFNIASIFMEKRRVHSQHQPHSLPKKLYLYIALSTAFFVVTTTPWTIVNLMPYDASMMTLSCEICQEMLTLHLWFSMLMICNCLSDNLLYLAVSKTYRLELKLLFLKLYEDLCFSPLETKSDPALSLKTRSPARPSFLGYLASQDDPR